MYCDKASRTAALALLIPSGAFTDFSIHCCYARTNDPPNISPLVKAPGLSCYIPNHRVLAEPPNPYKFHIKRPQLLWRPQKF